MSVQPEPAVVHQPASHTTVVVNQQVRPTVRGWSTGLCSFFDDCEICLCVMCFPCYAEVQLVQDVGEFTCLPCCVPNWLMAVRTKVRTQLDIGGSICDDCVLATVCQPCVLCQLKREVKLARQQGLM